MAGDLDPAAGVFERRGLGTHTVRACSVVTAVVSLSCHFLRAWADAGVTSPTPFQRSPSPGTAGDFRPMGVPAVKEAFGLEDIREHDEWRVFATTAKSKRKHKKKSKEPNLLPRWFAYLAYAVAFCMFGMTIVVATLYGSTFLGITQYAWGIATITTLLVQFLLFEPLIIWARAFIEVRARLLQAMAPKPQEVEEEPTQDELEALPNKEDVTADQARDHDEDVAFNLPGSPEELVPDVLERHLPQLVDLFLLNFKGGVVGLEDFSELLTDFGVQADDPRLQEYWDSLPLNDNRESEWQPMLRACAKK
eukprot:2580276-Rhodomonas_salina.1